MKKNIKEHLAAESSISNLLGPSINTHAIEIIKIKNKNQQFKKFIIVKSFIIYFLFSFKW